MRTIYNFNEAGLHLSHGNDKLGRTIWNINFVPGNEEHRPTMRVHDSENYKKLTGEEVYITNVIGTCSKHCSQCANSAACYAFHSLVQHHNRCAKAWSENTILLRSGKLFEELDKAITLQQTKKDKIAKFRINTAGELENIDQLNGWNDLALKHPEIIFSIYTKNYEVIEELLNSGKTVADNFVINISQWNHEADEFLAKYPGQFNVFEYDGTNRKNHDFLDEDVERLSKLVHCPAVLKTGVRSKVTCDQCMRCYKKTGKITAVFAH